MTDPTPAALAALRRDVEATPYTDHLIAADVVLSLLDALATRDATLAMQGRELARIDRERIEALERCARIDDERAAEEAARIAAEAKLLALGITL